MSPSESFTRVAYSIRIEKPSADVNFWHLLGECVDNIR